MARSSQPARKRHRLLEKMIQKDGNLSVTQTAEKLGVSPMTIRRDLKVLEKSGATIRCYGGAVAAQRITFEFAFDERHQAHLAQKRRIGRAAAERIRDGQTLFLDTGTTTLEIARALRGRDIRCDIITGSLVIASELWGKPKIGLQLLGGEVRRGSPDLVGPYSEAMLDRLTADVAFLGSEALDPQRGSFAADPESARIAEKMATHAQTSIVVADSSKLGRAGPVRYIKTDDIDELITDKKADATLLRRLRSRGVRVACV